MSEEGMGVLDVFVFKASGLVKMDLTGLCDPYVTLTMTNDDGTGGGKVKRTKYIRQNLNPEFNQEFHFTVYKLSQMLVIKVYDHDDLGADDLMGTRRIPVAELVEKDWQEWFHMLDQLGHEIIGEDGTMCRVKLDIKYTPHPTREMAALGRAIYVDAGAGEHQVKESIKRAAGCQPRKRVLIQFGADWNDSCKKFHFLLREDKDCAAMCAEFFEYFLLDAEHEANFDIMKRLGEPQWLGFPVFVILDHAGAYIHTQSAGPLEYDPIFTATDPDPAKLLKFLSYWKAGGENDATEEEGRGVRDTREHLATLVTPGSEVSPLPFDTGPRKHV